MSLERIRSKLTDVFSPTTLEIIDESEHHRGHGSFTGQSGTHLRIRIVSEKFSNTPRIDRHRAVNRILKPEFDQRLHALALELYSPNETTPEPTRS